MRFGATRNIENTRYRLKMQGNPGRIGKKTQISL